MFTWHSLISVQDGELSAYLFTRQYQGMLRIKMHEVCFLLSRCAPLKHLVLVDWIMSLKIAVIGSGPCRMALFSAFEELKQKSEAVQKSICSKKQVDLGAVLNLTCITGLDEHCEPVYGSIYKHLWKNKPKESLEIPNFMFQKHLNKSISLYPPRVVIRNYLMILKMKIFTKMRVLGM